VRAAHQLLEGTPGEPMGEEIRWTPAGAAHPIGVTYAQVVISGDVTMSGLLKGDIPLFAGAWANRAGVSEFPSGPDPNAPGFPDWRGWGPRVNRRGEAGAK